MAVQAGQRYTGGNPAEFRAKRTSELSRPCPVSVFLVVQILSIVEVQRSFFCKYICRIWIIEGRFLVGLLVGVCENMHLNHLKGYEMFDPNYFVFRQKRDLFDPINWHLLPEHLRPGAIRYIEGGIKPGSFLTAVICNDLQMAVGHADEASLAALPEIVRFFYNELPGNCWGSKKIMKAWMETPSEDPPRGFLSPAVWPERAMKEAG